MPALICRETTVAPIVKKRALQQQVSLDIFKLPEICDLIAHHLDKTTLTIVVRVSSHWYATWIRHLWRRVRVESGTATKAPETMQAFPRLSGLIRQLEWTHLSDSASPASLILQSMDLSQLNLYSLLLSNWSTELNADTLLRFVKSSAHRLSVLRLHNMTRIRGDLFKVAGSLPSLQHLSLTMAEEDSGHRRCGRRSNDSAPTLPGILPAGSERTSADSLLELMNNCPQLRVIEIQDLRPSKAGGLNADVEADSDSSSVLDVDVAKESAAGRAWEPMQHLTTINLCATTISGSTLSAIFARCPQLIKLNLNQTSPLYLSGFHLDPLIAMNALSTLTLSGCHFLDGHGYKQVFKACPKLLNLDISQTNVDDAALGVLSHSCPYLVDLNMDGSQQITDRGLKDMFSHRPAVAVNSQQGSLGTTVQQGPYQNNHLQSLSLLNCTELTGQGVYHILMTCARLRFLDIQQPELLPESLFPHSLESDEGNEPTTIYPEAENGPASIHETNNDAFISSPWACHSTLEHLRFKNLNVINSEQTKFLNARLRELSQLKVLHIGGSQLELSILDGLGHQLESLYIDDLAREVNLDDVRWLVDHTPNLKKLWCRQLIRYSEPWKLLRGARQHLKVW
ncbi:hypothetical protein BGX34_005098 [Mortierella sp. NVP85]|nr:hypothetical protein BGX34_005098 [Mortierella sp. NVP85]